jgi:hypothetical protein
VPSDESIVSTELETIRVGSPRQEAHLQVFGLQRKSDGATDSLTLDEALSENEIEVKEVNAQGRVSVIQISNRPKRMVFIMCGEMLVGCKQNRVLNTSVLVPSKNEAFIPVACVEAGRWHYRSSQFRSSPFSSHTALRKVLSKSTSTQYRLNGVPHSDQRAVWGEVARKMKAMAFTSETDALEEMFQDSRNLITQVEGNLSAPEGYHGALFASNGKILGAELFDKPSTLLRLWTKIIGSYVLDVLDQKVPLQSVEAQSAAEWLKSISSAKETRTYCTTLRKTIMKQAI